MDDLTRPGPGYDPLFRLLDPCPNCSAMWLEMYLNPSADRDRVSIWCRACSSNWTGKSEGEAYNNLKFEIFSQEDPDSISAGSPLDAVVWNEIYMKHEISKEFSPSTKVADAEALLSWMETHGFGHRCTGVQMNGGEQPMGMLGYTIFIWRRDEPREEWKRITAQLEDWPAIVCRTALDAVRSARAKKLRMNG